MTKKCEICGKIPRGRYFLVSYKGTYPDYERSTTLYPPMRYCEECYTEQTRLKKGD